MAWGRGTSRLAAGKQVLLAVFMLATIPHLAYAIQTRYIRWIEVWPSQYDCANVSMPLRTDGVSVVLDVWGNSDVIGTEIIPYPLNSEKANQQWMIYNASYDGFSQVRSLSSSMCWKYNSTNLIQDNCTDDNDQYFAFNTVEVEGCTFGVTPTVIKPYSDGNKCLAKIDSKLYWLPCSIPVAHYEIFFVI